MYVLEDDERVLMTAANRKARLRRRVLLVGLVLALLACTPLLWQVYWRVPGKVDFFLYRTEYENIVRIVKTQEIASGEISKTQHIDSYRVWGRRSETGQYTITIQTADWGHWGYGGYVYTDREPPINQSFITGRLDDHWWTYHDNTW